MSPTSRQRAIAALVNKADAAFTALVNSKGVDSHQKPIEGLAESVLAALLATVQAGKLAEEELQWSHGNDNGS